MSKKDEIHQGLKVELDATGTRDIIKDLLQTTQDLVDLMKQDKVKVSLRVEELE